LQPQPGHFRIYLEIIMVQVVCTRPNAAEEISGVKFTKHDQGMLSEEISDEQAAHFLAVPGYHVLGEHPAGEDHEADDIEALRARATELGVEVKPAWKAPRLKAEIKRAEDEAAAKAAAEAAGKTE
jgi:hypothetical protein